MSGILRHDRGIAPRIISVLSESGSMGSAVAWIVPTALVVEVPASVARAIRLRRAQAKRRRRRANRTGAR